MIEAKERDSGRKTPVWTCPRCGNKYQTVMELSANNINLVCPMCYIASGSGNNLLEQAFVICPARTTLCD